MRWIAYSPGDKYAIKLLDNAGCATHSVARIILASGCWYEAWRLGPPLTYLGKFRSADEAKAECVEDAR